VILVWIVVAAAVLVATCASIKASQSTLVVVFVPEVVVAKAAVAAAEVELVTVAMPPYFPVRRCGSALPLARVFAA
jgi:uncharacterized lipoprotein YmbA